MTQYILRRIVAAIPVIFGILFVTFALSRLLPGDPCRAILGERATDELCRPFIIRYGLDRPIPVQFGLYLQQLAQGDLGSSIRYGRPVVDLLIERLPVTLELSACALGLAVLVGVPAGILSAYRRNSAIDVSTMLLANIGVSMPVFWLGLMLQYIFALTLKNTFLQLPPSGRITAGMTLPALANVWNLQATEGAWYKFVNFLSNMYIFNAFVTGNWGALGDVMVHLILPTIALATIPLAIIARMTRSSLLEVMGLDYVRTARAKGLRDLRVVFRHALRNALLPVVTIIGLSLGALLGGAVLTETVFNLAGMGRLLYDAIQARDYVIVQAITLIIAIVFVVLNLIIDIMYAFLDPRIRLS